MSGTREMLVGGWQHSIDSTSPEGITRTIHQPHFMILLPVKLHTSPIGLREGKSVTGVAHQQEQRLICWMSFLERASKMGFFQFRSW